MNWIKKNPAQFGLVVVSVLLLASSYFLWASYSEFPASVSGGKDNAAPRKDIPITETAEIDKAAQSITAPEFWAPEQKSRLLAGILWVSTPDGKLVDPLGPGSRPLLPPMENTWVLKYGLDILNKVTADEDVDRDGFSARVEWDGRDGVSHLSETEPYGPVNGPNGQPLPADMTDPTNPQDHPEYYTRLKLEVVKNIPFRLRLMSYDINPRKPADINVQINTLDVGNRSLFIPLGEDIKGTKYKTEKFEKKMIKGADGLDVDVSELTIINKETGTVVVLPYLKVVDSPESFVVIKYLWVPPNGQAVPDMNKQKGQTFTIPPNDKEIYKVIDIRPEEVDIQLPSGQKYTLRVKK